ncbi:MAG: hypothetical protein EOO71_00840 [Myxococcaceae bacterium]|nr:MAG: hypothetical protein EOO71_00840 [Myxococcaceae bacterium]
MRTNIFVGLVLAGLSGVGCADKAQDTPAPAVTTTPQTAQAPLEQETPDQDTLATRAYERVRQDFAQGRAASLKFPVYDLQPVGDATARVQQRALFLGINQGYLLKSEDGATVNANSLSLRVDALSGAEFFVDKSRFHAGAGVATLPLSEPDYIARARTHVKAKLPEAVGHELRTYRVRRYLNDASGPGGVRAGVTVYQVAVAFHEVLGELPVIGAGGKVAVHLTPQGEVISHEATLRETLKPFAEVSGAQLLAPDEARRQVEAKLTAQGLKLGDYKLTRAELGYYRLGRNSVQSVLVPHYAYFYEPNSREVVGKKRLEVVPAVTDRAILERVQQDAASEAARKTALRARAAPPDTK